MDEQSSEYNESKSTFTKSSFQDESGFTDLHIAAWTGNTKKLSALLKKNPDINVQDNEMRTPLHLATAQGHREIVEALVKADADVNIKDKGENTPLLKALEVGNKTVAKYLIEKGADLHLADSDGNSALHIAIQKGYKKLVLQILKKVNDVNVTNKRGETPLHVAASNDMIDCVKQLLQRGAIIDSCDSQNRTPLMHACSKGHSTVVDNLLQAGAEPYLLDESGLTAEDIAEAEGHADAANIVATYLYKNEASLSSKRKEPTFSLGFQQNPEILLTAPPEKSKKKKYFTETRMNYNDIDNQGQQRLLELQINEGTVNKVSAIMDDMKGTSDKLSQLHAELKQRQLAEQRNKEQIEKLRKELDKALLERSKLLGTGKTARESIKSVKDELYYVHENVHKLQADSDKIEQKLIDEETANADLKRYLERAKGQEQEIRQAMDKLGKHIEEMKVEKETLEKENCKMDAMINSLKNDLQDKERARSDWSGRMAAVNTEKSNMLLQVEMLDKDKNSKQTALDECIRNYESKVQTMMAERNALEKRLNGEVWRRAIADKKILALQQEITNVTDESNTTKKEVKDLQTKLEEQSCSHSNAEKILREQVEILKSDNVTLSERVNDLKVSLQQLESELEKEHIESDTIICGLHKELNKTNALLRDKSRDMGDNYSV